MMEGGVVKMQKANTWIKEKTREQICGCTQIGNVKTEDAEDRVRWMEMFSSSFASLYSST